jgi:hypothetical protein
MNKTLFFLSLCILNLTFASSGFEPHSIEKNDSISIDYFIISFENISVNNCSSLTSLLIQPITNTILGEYQVSKENNSLYENSTGLYMILLANTINVSGPIELTNVYVFCNNSTFNDLTSIRSPFFSKDLLEKNSSLNISVNSIFSSPSLTDTLSSQPQHTKSQNFGGGSNKKKKFNKKRNILIQKEIDMSSTLLKTLSSKRAIPKNKTIHLIDENITKKKKINDSKNLTKQIMIRTPFQVNSQHEKILTKEKTQKNNVSYQKEISTVIKHSYEILLLLLKKILSFFPF